MTSGTKHPMLGLGSGRIWPLCNPIMAILLHAGFMRNEFEGTSGWGCPCAEQPGGCAFPCSFSGEDVLTYYAIIDINKVGTGPAVQVSSLGHGCFVAAWLHKMSFGTAASSAPLAVQWVCLAILVAWAFAYRALFFLTLKYKEARSK
jgi:hypothetical protein